MVTLTRPSCVSIYKKTSTSENNRFKYIIWPFYNENTTQWKVNLFRLLYEGKLLKTSTCNFMYCRLVIDYFTGFDFQVNHRTWGSNNWTLSRKNENIYILVCTVSSAVVVFEKAYFVCLATKHFFDASKRNDYGAVHRTSNQRHDTARMYS